MRMRWGAVVAACVVAMATTCTAACQRVETAVVADRSSSPSVTVEPAGPTTGDLFLSGVVRRDGRAAQGATVLLSVMQDDLDGPVGSVVDTWQSPKVTTGVDGRFELHLKPRDVPEKFLPATKELLNFDLQVEDQDEVATWSWTLWPHGVEGIWRTDGAGADDAVASADVDFGRSPTIVLTDSDGQVEELDLPVGRVR